jgi:protein-S-isoprenylcysteine O-methyltransferase Ste14
MRSVADLSIYLIPALWAVWIAGWGLAARDVKPARWKEKRRDAIFNRVPVLLGIVLFTLPARVLPAVLGQRIVPAGPEAPFYGVVLTALGLAVAGWARWHLGRNWSAEVSVKEGHTLIRSGPYRAVRHPIYSGMLLALIGTSLAIGSARGFIATALILAGFMVKLSAEEARMRETFADYAEYCRHTARLIPGVF